MTLIVNSAIQKEIPSLVQIFCILITLGGVIGLILTENHAAPE
jgi:hypothetical protein